MTYGIVISSYKYGHLAAHCIESVLAQTKPFHKIWFVDDGAGDCKHLPYIYSDRVEFILRDGNLGIVDNFNAMLHRVDTDYVMFLGADNWLRSDALFQIDRAMQKNAAISPMICVYDIIVTGELRHEIYQTYHQQMFPKDGDWYWNRSGFHHGSMLYHVETAKKLGGYAHNKTSERTDEDQNLWDKFMKAGHNYIHVEQALLYYRRHKENFNKY